MTYLELAGNTRTITCLPAAADVREVRADLTDSQAWEALKLAHGGNHSAGGLTADAIDRAVHTLYGWPQQPAEA